MRVEREVVEESRTVSDFCEGDTELSMRGHDEGYPRLMKLPTQ